MMTEICQYLRNWFNRKPDGSDYPKYEGTFTIENGVLVTDDLAEGQYFRIMGSLFNDGVHAYHAEHGMLRDETFTGVIWSMGVPPEVTQLATDIANWQTKYGDVEGEAMSPFQSESFGGYSYSKAGGGNSGTDASSAWQTAFAARLAPWRKI